MTTAAIRERLYDYIRVADEKKLKAIYTILEDEIEEETEWWKNQSFITELENRYNAWEAGKEKAFTMEDINDNIKLLKTNLF